MRGLDVFELDIFAFVVIIVIVLFRIFLDGGYSEFLPFSDWNILKIGVR